jgi:drug/metabolite transporter (DMT)-like permease
MVIGSSFGQERPTRRGVAGVVLSIVGVGAIFSEGLSDGGSGLARRQ